MRKRICWKKKERKEKETSKLQDKKDAINQSRIGGPRNKEAGPVEKIAVDTSGVPGKWSNLQGSEGTSQVLSSSFGWVDWQ